MKTLPKQEISYLPFSDFANITDSIRLGSELDSLKLKLYDSWMMPQILAFWGQMKVFKDDSGNMLPKAFLEHNIGRDPFRVGLWRVCVRAPRGYLVQKQAIAGSAKYSSLVPLILAGLKEYQNIPYSAWETCDLTGLVEQSLLDSMMTDVPELSVERILEIRTQGLTVKSGPKAGSISNPVSKWALTGIADTELGGLPNHAVTMICQTWVAHPTLRHPLMILNPDSWDDMPKPLIDTEVVQPLKEPKPPKAETNGYIDLPWLA